MTGPREFFSDLDSSVKGFVKFSNASTIEIKGVGSVIFKAKTGEHCLLTGVYYNPALKNSIISVGQLDENSLWVEIEDGVLHIWDRGRHLSRLGGLGKQPPLCAHVQVAQPLYLAAHWDDEAWRWLGIWDRCCHL
jgi:hypothetical protein